MPSRLLTIAETRATLGVGNTKLYQLIGTGALPAVKVGRGTRIPESAVRSFIESLPPASIRTGQQRPAR